MTSRREELPDTAAPSAAVCAQASAWIARLHGEERTARVEQGFKRWLAASPAHRAAFEMANEIWVGAERVPKPLLPPAVVRWPGSGVVVTVPRALIACAVAALLITGAMLYSRGSGLSTRIGEQRNLSLEDGTRISLNTASRIHVYYDRATRRVELERGEAFFEVARRPNWPFTVTVGGKQIRALGTSFLVRTDGQSVAITLMEGKVEVSSGGKTSPESAGSSSSSSSSSLRPTGSHSNEEITLSPGQRVTFAVDETPTLDRPALEKMTAWQRGQVILDHTPLGDAVAELNRYSDVELKIDKPETARAQVTGIFRVGDSESFAQAVAETYHLKIVVQAGQIVLTGVPRSGGAPL